MRVSLMIFGFCIAAFTTSVPAHETWMMPSSFATKIGEDVRIDVSSGMKFPWLESPIAIERVVKASYRLGETQGDLTGLETEEKSLLLRQSFDEEGLATIWIDLAPKDIELTDDVVAEYLDEIDATEDVRSEWAAQKGRIPWIETYTKHAKTFVAIGDASDDSSWGVGVDAALELVPASSPLAVVVGDEFTAELRANAAPLANIPVGLLIEGAPAHVFRTTDSHGRVTFPIKTAGRAMLFAVRLLRAKDGKSWISDFCTMTFEARRQE